MRDSLVLKTGMIGLLTLLLLIPLAMIRGKISERQSYQDTVRQQVAKSWSGIQTLLAPVLIQPYVIEIRNETGSGPYRAYTTTTEQKIKMFAPESINVDATLATERRHKGIYSVPVYDATLQIRGRINMQQLQTVRMELSQQTGFYSLGKPYIALALDDQRGISAAPKFTFNDKAMSILPGSGIPGWPAGIRAEVPEPEDVSLPLSMAQNGRFAVTLGLRGMESLLVVPAANWATVSLASSWPHPEFVGAFLPASRHVDQSGFSARWSVNEFNNLVGGRLAACEMRGCQELRAAGLGVHMFEPVNVYLLAERASKYGILFIGLSFAAFFAMEMTRRLRIHPVQYACAGLALALFFLLLISLSEHINFGSAYCIAAASCIALLGYYLRHILRGRRGAGWFSIALAGIYGMLYLTLQAEDYALLMGAILSFAALAAVMAATRDIDWYQLQPATPNR